MNFEWDPNKAQANVIKHGVSFEEAYSVFDDPLSTTWPDPRHSGSEDRYLLVGTSRNGRLLGIVHTYRDTTIRIISARGLTPQERKRYEQSN